MITETRTPTVEQPAPAAPGGDGATPPRTPPPRSGRRTSPRLRRRLVYAALAIAVLALAWLALRPTPVPVELGVVTRGSLRVTLEADGVTRVIERYTVSAPVAGRVERITVREGDAVSVGTVVARLTPAPLDPRDEARARAAVAAAVSLAAGARSRVEQARAAYLQAVREAERRRELADSGALSLEQREQAELAASLRERELQAAQATARAADAEVTAARAALVSTLSGGSAIPVLVRSAVAGRVLRVPERSERVVAAGAPLLELGDAAGLELVLDLLSTDAVAVRPGTPLLVTSWGGADTLRGRVRHVAPAAFTEVSALGVEEQRVNVIGELLGAPRGLGDAYRVEAAIVISEATGVLRAPTSSLFQRGDGWRVFVVRDGRAHLREVRPGRRGEGVVEILGGLRSGERVIRYPSDALAHGARVRESGASPRGS